MNKHWYLIGERSGARIFEQDGIKPELRLVRNFENPDGRLSTSELVSDRQGRSDSNINIGRSAVGDNDGPRQYVLEHFAHELGEYLEQEAEHNKFSSLVLVAEPHMLGELKKAMKKSTASRMRDSVTKDLLHVSDRDIAAHLQGVLCVREEIRP